MLWTFVVAGLSSVGEVSVCGAYCRVPGRAIWNRVAG